MSDDTWRVLDDLLAAALELPPADRAAFVEHERAANPERAARLERLLANAATGDSLSPGGAFAGALGRSLDAEDAHLTGRILGRYRVEEEIGRGGMAVVFRATRAEGDFRQTVAIKLLKRGVDTDEVVRRFERERQILAQADHPNLARLYDAGVGPGGRPYLVLEHVDGRPIDRFADEERLDLPARLRLFRQVVGAVAAAHRNLVVHRDIKPSNVLVTADGHAKLLDFGIAKLLDPTAEDGKTATRLRPMTPAFASPEQLAGEAITTATDVYQLGLLLRLLLRDQRLDRDLETLLATALRPEPERRYGGAAELGADVDRYLAGRPLAARPDRFSYRLSKFLARHRAAVVVFLVALSGIAGTVTVATLRLRAERDRATAAATRATRSAEMLRGLFSAAAPAATRGQDMTARALLERGARQVLAELPEEPELAAELLTEIGTIYGELALYEEGQPHLERAVELRRRPPVDGPGLARSLHALGRMVFARGDFARARRLHEEALALRRSAAPSGDAKVAASADALAQVLAVQNELEPARRLFAEALALYEASEGPESAEVGRVAGHLGAHLRRGEEEEARRWLERSARVLAASLGPDHPDTAEAEVALAENLERLGELDAAGQRYVHALPLLERIYGVEHPRYLDALFAFAVLEDERGHHGEALEILARVKDLRTRRLGGDHVALAEVWNAIGVAERSRENIVAAEAAFRQAAAVHDRALGADHVDAAVPLGNLAKLLEQSRRTGEAMVVYRQVVGRFERGLGRDHPALTVPLSRLAELELGAGRPAVAEELLRRVLGIATRLPGGEHAVALPRATLGQTLVALGRFVEAEALLEQLATDASVHEEARRRAREGLAELARRRGGGQGGS
ncbi:MAG: serine/threonine-protein kinase [Thermoanaerobaculia bacterium]|nr:serine/threonine-protein kinase [Thermoanaerobaculia bacterium]